MTQQQTRSMAAPHAAPRCQHITLDEQPCGAPALRGRRFCRFHQHIDAPRDYSIPAFEDAAGVQLALMQVVRALQDKAIDTKTASLTLYALQIAATNLKRFQAERDAAFPALDYHHPGEEILVELKRVLEEERSQPAASSDATPAAVPEIKASAEHLPITVHRPPTTTIGNRQSTIGNHPVRTAGTTAPPAARAVRSSP